ncbi:Uncharacterised protein [Bordetella pertussis]|nr:Uncharacterised protein [Bordetella pertussis]
MKATALAAMTCISGPPWMPGKMAELTAFSNSAFIMMTPPRGPRSDLCVVEVTKSACGTGLG